MTHRAAVPVAVFLAALALLPLGCATSAPEQTELMRQSPEVVATATELRIRVRVFAGRFAHLVEDAADRIMQEAEGEPAAQLAALEWKSKAIAQAQTSCFHSDPMAALFDTWAFAIQQRMYFEDPASSRHFGEWRPVGLAASQQIEDEIEDIARIVKRDGDITNSRAFVEDWALSHPVDGEWLRRKSILGQLADALAADNLGAFAALGRMAEDVSDLSMRASLYNEMLPKQSRWQAELLAHDLGLVELQHSTATTIPELVAIAERAVAMGDSLPGLTARERQAVFAELHVEVTRVLEHLRQGRGEVLRETDELIAARWAAIAADLPELARQSVHHTKEPMKEVIDHAAARALQVGGIGLVTSFLLGLLFVRLTRRGP